MILAYSERWPMWCCYQKSQKKNLQKKIIESGDFLKQQTQIDLTPPNSEKSYSSFIDDYQFPEQLITKIPPSSHDTNNPTTPDNSKEQKIDNHNPILAKLF